MDQSFFPVYSVFVVSAHNFYYSEKVVDSGKLDPMEAIGNEVGIMVVNIGQRQCMYKGNMARKQ